MRKWQVKAVVFCLASPLDGCLPQFPLTSRSSIFFGNSLRVRIFVCWLKPKLLGNPSLIMWYPHFGDRLLVTTDWYWLVRAITFLGSKLNCVVKPPILLGKTMEKPWFPVENMSKSAETCEIPIFLYQFWVHRGSSVRRAWRYRGLCAAWGGLHWFLLRGALVQAGCFVGKMENDKAIYIDRISDTGHNRI